MKKFDLTYLALAAWVALAALPAPPALAQLPKRDLIIEVREVDVGEGGAYTVGTQAGKALLAPQQLRVRNGEKASLSVGRSMPIEWIESASASTASSSSAGMAGAGSGASVSKAVAWMDSGQGIFVQAQWPGAQQPVKVELEVQSASVQAGTGADLAAQSRRQLVTTVSAPVGQWVSIAFTGQSRHSGVYGSEADADPRRVLQIRVLAP